MPSNPESGPKPNTPERLSKFMRNINAIGAVALGAAGVVVESALLLSLSVIDGAQAVFFEITRRMSKNKPKLQPA